LSEGTVVSFEEVRKELGAPPDVFNALVVSGLLGPPTSEGLRRTAVDDFLRYGTQWTAAGDRLAPYYNLPDIPEGPTPILSYTRAQISPHPNFGKADDDTGWIAQFYIKPNRRFFPYPMGLALVGPSHLRLEGPLRVKGSTFPSYLYPDPMGEFSMLTVIGNPDVSKEPFRAAYDVAVPVLDELSFRCNQPLPVAQVFLVGIPSGTISLEFLRPPDMVVLGRDTEVLACCPHPQLQAAVALYRDGLSDSNPFHQFLAFWKVYENACHVRAEWRMSNKRRGPIGTPEVMPDMFVFRHSCGKTFEEVRQTLTPTHRNAIAHSDGRKAKPKTPALASDFIDVSCVIPVIGYIARVTLENVRALLEDNDLS
jgi:hypothetical protein